ITVAGEACPAELVARWAKQRRFFNLYGPTEATIWATFAECFDSSRRPPIGRPIPGTQVYVLDQHRKPVPIGVTGELYIGGMGLARGYHNRPELTAEHFIRNPFSHHLDARLYKTGDRVRYLPDGNLEFLGRLDHQVKVRGFRIELREIEEWLRRHSDVRDCVVVLRENTSGEKRLVAYVAGDPNTSLVKLRSHLRQRLPEYMMPSAFVILDELPHTPNGKIDRKALPDSEKRPISASKTLAPPQNAVEQIITDIWKEALRVDRIGRDDNFFDLGGH